MRGNFNIRNVGLRYVSHIAVSEKVRLMKDTCITFCVTVEMMKVAASLGFISVIKCGRNELILFRNVCLHPRFLPRVTELLLILFCGIVEAFVFVAHGTLVRSEDPEGKSQE